MQALICLEKGRGKTLSSLFLERIAEDREMKKEKREGKRRGQEKEK